MADPRGSPYRQLLGARFRAADAELVELACDRAGISLSELIRSAVLQEARRILTPTPTSKQRGTRT